MYFTRWLLQQSLSLSKVVHSAHFAIPLDYCNMSSSILSILVIAHPDDESMFFVPTLVRLKQQNARAWVVCLSNGNYDGLGRIREKELQRACQILGVEKCVTVHDALLQDDPNLRWPATRVAEVLEMTLQEHLFDNDDDEDSVAQLEILTFDQGGVSGHVNHVDTHRGVQYWLSSTTAHRRTAGGAKAFQLETISNPLIKYIPLLWIPILLFDVIYSQHAMQWRLFQPWTNYGAMAAHTSQFVWYRRLSVLFSRYTYYNAFTEIDK